MSLFCHRKNGRHLSGILETITREEQENGEKEMRK